MTLGDNMKVVLDKDTVSAGKVTFAVQNTGTLKHEVLVLKTDAAPGQIPAGDDPGTVSEKTSVGESDDMDPGTSKTFTLDLAAGNYLLICNEAGHFAAGMHTPFLVK
ncbi:MAG: cupredoxin domain-containing protein [Chloroflexota bacterium]|nr:cupredoxin domain-containing protein [Chloroflexota bacterium]MDE3193991.1 cupredoxin domain-containing protein [Chloroflexota bacterium]